MSQRLLQSFGRGIAEDTPRRIAEGVVWSVPLRKRVDVGFRRGGACQPLIDLMYLTIYSNRTVTVVYPISLPQ